MLVEFEQSNICNAYNMKLTIGVDEIVDNKMLKLLVYNTNNENSHVFYA